MESLVGPSYHVLYHREQEDCLLTESLTHSYAPATLKLSCPQLSLSLSDSIMTASHFANDVGAFKSAVLYEKEE